MNCPKKLGRLARVLGQENFAITSETTPPLTSDPSIVVKRMAPFVGLVHAFNVTDGAGTWVHLTSFATAHFMQVENGLEGDLLGVAGFAIPNVLRLSGDLNTKSAEPAATTVNDLDSAGRVAVAMRMREDGLLPSGRKIKPQLQYFIGVVDMPIDPANDWRPTNLLAKIAAGADFAQT